MTWCLHWVSMCICISGLVSWFAQLSECSMQLVDPKWNLHLYIPYLESVFHNLEWEQKGHWPIVELSMNHAVTSTDRSKDRTIAHIHPSHQCAHYDIKVNLPSSSLSSKRAYLQLWKVVKISRCTNTTHASRSWDVATSISVVKRPYGCDKRNANIIVSNEYVRFFMQLPTNYNAYE